MPPLSVPPSLRCCTSVPITVGAIDIGTEDGGVMEPQAGMALEHGCYASCVKLEEDTNSTEVKVCFLVRVPEQRERQQRLLEVIREARHQQTSPLVPG